MKRTFVTFALLIASALSLASDPVGLKELTAKAIKNHPLLASARADVETERAKKSGLTAPFKPQLSLNAYGAAGSGSMIFPGTVEPTNYALLPTDGTGVLNGTFMWRLYSFGRDRDLDRSGSAAVKASQARLSTEELDVALRVRLAFAEALFKRETTLAHHAAHESANEILKVTQARFEAGKVPEAFVLRAKAEVASALREVAMAEADEARSSASLWEAAGLEQDGTQMLGSWDATLTAPQSLEMAMKEMMLQRPELAAFTQEMEQMKLLASAARKAGLPELSLMGMNDWMGTRGMSGSSTYKAGLVLSFPVGDGGTRLSERKTALSGLAKATASYQVARNHVQAEVVAAWAEWQASSKIEQSAGAEVIASEESYRVALLRYQEGKAILAELTDSQSMLSHARLSVAQATAYKRKAWSNLSRAIGASPSEPDNEASHAR